MDSQKTGGTISNPPLVGNGVCLLVPEWGKGGDKVQDGQPNSFRFPQGDQIKPLRQCLLDLKRGSDGSLRHLRTPYEASPSRWPGTVGRPEVCQQGGESWPGSPKVRQPHTNQSEPARGNKFFILYHGTNLYRVLSRHPVLIGEHNFSGTKLVPVN